jgi:hypothetical protein
VQRNALAYLLLLLLDLNLLLLRLLLQLCCLRAQASTRDSEISLDLLLKNILLLRYLMLQSNIVLWCCGIHKRFSMCARAAARTPLSKSRQVMSALFHS